MSAAGSIRSRPKATISRAVRCSSAANSVPVAPAPMTATWSWPGRTGACWFWARRQAFTRRRLNRRACSAVSSGTAYSAAPFVPKSLVTLPMAITSVS